MAFNIRDFNATIKEHGVNKGNLFRMRILPPSAIAGEVISDYGTLVQQHLEYYCKSVTLPELEVTTADIQHQGFGVVTRRPQTMGFPVLPAVFNVDSDMKIVKYFHRWSQCIINYDNSAGVQGDVDGALPFELGYKSEYATRLLVDVFDSNGGLAYTYEFDGAYPTSVGNLEAAWANNDEVVTLSVGFTFDSMKVSGAKSGDPAGVARINYSDPVENIVTTDALENEQNIAPLQAEERRLNRANGSRFSRRVNRRGREI